MHKVGLRMTQQESPFYGFYITSHINKKYGYGADFAEIREEQMFTFH
jgi:hypothetical protein